MPFRHPTTAYGGDPERAATVMRALLVGIWFCVFISACFLGLIAWWRLTSPAPDVAVRDNTIRTPGPETGRDEAGAYVLRRPGTFEVVRLLEVRGGARDYRGTVTSIFVHRPEPGSRTLLDGREAIPDSMAWALSEMQDTIHGGPPHLRSRVMEIPRLLPAGDYWYRAIWRFCQPFNVRCDEVRFPDIPVVLADPE